MSNEFERPNNEDHDDNDEVWLISYSDLMTLLFGFFVIMYAFSTAKQGDVQKTKEGISRSFGGKYIQPYDKLAEQIAQESEKESDLKMIDVENPKDGMEITFRSSLLFDSGSAEVKPEIKKTLQMVAKMISKNIGNAEILIAGHTDDVPINSKQFPSNWELSSARASNVVREFIEFGYDPGMLAAVGYADTRPEYPNKDEKGLRIKENMEKNRRVVLKVVAPGIVKQPSSKSTGEKNE